MKKILCIVMAAMLLGVVGCVSARQQGAPDTDASGKIALGIYHIVAVNENGTVRVSGNNNNGECNVSGWRDIRSVAVGYRHTVGLKKDGTVVATGLNDRGQCNVQDWKNVRQITADGDTTVALFEDGTVASTRYEMSTGSWEEIKEWKDLVEMSMGSVWTIGIQKGGTVVRTRYIYKNAEKKEEAEDEAIDLSGWKDIVAVAQCDDIAVGLKSDGKLEMAGNKKDKEQRKIWEASNWSGICGWTL